MNYTPILKLHVPDFDQIPWDYDVNTNWAVLDAAIGMFTTIPNMAGAWQNSTAYTTGQSVVDSADGSVWSCVISHTSSASPQTFAQDRVAYPMYWSQISSAVGIYAQEAAASATAAAASAATAQAAAATAATAVPITGGTMTGLLILSGDPTNVLGAATKQYVDARVGGSGFLPTTGGTLTGALEIGAQGVAFTNQAANKHSMSFGWTGSVIPVLVDGTSVGNLATQSYVAGGYLPITGGTITGSLQINNNLGIGIGAPSDAVNAVTASGLFVRPNGYFGLNVYASTSTSNWKYAGTGYASLFALDGSGNAILYSAPNGAAGGTPAWTTSYTFNQNGTFACPNLNTGAVTASGIIASNGSRILSVGSGNNPSVAAWSPSLNYAGGFWIATTNQINFGSTDGGGIPNGTYGYVNQQSIGFNSNTISITTNTGANTFCWGTYSDFNVPGQAWKPGGGVWATASDARIKDVLGDYTTGLEAILMLRPVRYKYKGNSDAHKEVAPLSIEFIGLVAQEAETAMPEMVTRTVGEIDGVVVDDLRNLDMTALPLALVNAVQELAARVAALEG